MNREAPEPSYPVGLKPLGPGAAALALLLAALWGGTPVSVHFAVDQLPPLFTAAVRFALASLFMLLWCRLEGNGHRLTAGQVVPALVNGLLLFVQIGLFTVGISMTSASHATVLINTFVFWVAVIDHFVTGFSRLTGTRIAGLLSAAAGGAILLVVAERTSTTAAQRDPASFQGDLLLAFSAAVLGIKIIYTKLAMRRVEPGKLMLWHDLFGMTLLLLASALVEPWPAETLLRLRLPTVLGLLYQGVVVSGFCFAAQAALLKRHAAAGVSVFSVATPLFGVVFAVMLRGDRLSPWLIVSALCATTGILLVNLPKRTGS